MVVSSSTISLLHLVTIAGVIVGLTIVSQWRTHKAYVVGGLPLAVVSAAVGLWVYFGELDRIVVRDRGGQITAARQHEIGMPHRGISTVIVNETSSPLTVKGIAYGLAGMGSSPEPLTVAPHTTFQFDRER